MGVAGYPNRRTPTHSSDPTPIAVGDVPDAVAAGPSGVWVANAGDNTIQRINPVSGAPDPAMCSEQDPVRR